MNTARRLKDFMALDSGTEDGLSRKLSRPPNLPAAIAKDEKTSTDRRCYLVSCRDGESSLLRLISTIKKLADPGHSFNVVVDPDSKDSETVFIDGDGSDRINSVVNFPSDSDFIGVLLSNINTIRWICNGAIPDEDDPNRETDDPVETLKVVRTSCDTLLDGAEYDFGRPARDTLRKIVEFCDNATTVPDERQEDVIKHIKSYCLDELRRKELAVSKGVLKK